jgi:hypothetical protein
LELMSAMTTTTQVNETVAPQQPARAPLPSAPAGSTGETVVYDGTQASDPTMAETDEQEVQELDSGELGGLEEEWNASNEGEEGETTETDEETPETPDSTPSEETPSSVPPMVQVTPEQFRQFQEDSVKLKVAERFINDPRFQPSGGAHGAANVGNQSGAQPTAAPEPVPVLPDDTEDWALAQAAFEQGDAKTGLERTRKAVEKREARQAVVFQHVLAKVLQPFASNQQEITRNMAWRDFCVADTDLKAEYDTRSGNPQAPTPLRDAMDVAMNSGLAANWQGALIIAKATRAQVKAASTVAPAPTPAPTPKPVARKTAVAANVMARPSRATQTPEPQPTGPLDLAACYKTTLKEMGLKWRD